MKLISTRFPAQASRRPSRDRLAAALLGAVVAFSLGCGYRGRALIPAFAHQGEIQLANSPLAKDWLRREYQRAPHLKEAVGDHGLPKYLLMVDRHVVHMVYPERDQVVSVNIETRWTFVLLPPLDRIVVHSEIPPVLLRLLPGDAQREILALREGQEIHWPSAAPVCGLTWMPGSTCP